jgi:ribonuclease T1
MRRTLLLLSFLSILSLSFCTGRDEPTFTTSPQPNNAAPGLTAPEKQDRIPEKARAVLKHIRETGKPPAGYAGGRIWHNRERNLPLRGHYHEYDVNPKIKGKNRGPERLVVDEASGKAWYTPDHYRTFIPIK